MAQKTIRWLYRSRESLPRFEDSVERVTTRYQLLLVGVVSALYLLITIQLAKTKLIWTDEFFTLYLGRLGLKDLWTALLTGGDQHPPFFYLIHHGFLRLLGEHSWTLRLPTILGFLLMMLCLYRFVAKRTSPVYGLVTMVIPLVTGAHEYAYEARGYSLQLGFLALAVACWQQAGEARLRTAAIFGLALALIGVVACHYYAVLILPAIAAAEVVRSLRRKSIDLMVWLAICAPIIPLLVCLPLIRACLGFAGTFWIKVSVTEVQLFYKDVLGSSISCVIFGLAVAALYRLIWRRGIRSTLPDSGDTFPVEEIILGAALTALPIAAYLFGKMVTGVFAWRYAIGAVVGISILFSFFCYRFLRGSAIAASLFVLTTLTYFTVVSHAATMKKLARERNVLKNFIGWLPSEIDDSEPLIVGDSKAFYALSYYSPPAMKGRYVYLVDPQRSLKYVHHDTIERSLWALSPWFGLNVKAYKPYLETHSQFEVWSGVDPKWTWLPSALIDDGEKLVLKARIGAGMLFSVSEGEP